MRVHIGIALAVSVLVAVVCSRPSALAGEDDLSPLVGPRTYALFQERHKFEASLLRLAPPEARKAQVRGRQLVIHASSAVVLNSGDDVDALLASLDSEDVGGQAPREFVVELPVDARERAAVLRGLDAARSGGWLLALGQRLSGEHGGFVPDTSRLDRGLGRPLIALARAERADAIRGAQVFIRVMQVRRVNRFLWQEVLGIRHPELRYVCIRDILAASYKYGLAYRSLAERTGIAREVVTALALDAGGRAVDRLGALLLAGDLDPSAEVRASMAGDDLRWWVHLVSGGTPGERAMALGAAASDKLISVARPIGIDLVLGALERDEALTGAEVAWARELLKQPGPPWRGLANHASALIAIIPRTYEAATVRGAARLQIIGLLADIARMAPDLARAVYEATGPEKDALRAWLDIPVPGAAAEDVERVEWVKAKFGASTR